MTQLTLHEPATAPDASRPFLAEAEKGFGMVPNLMKVLAESPAALEGYMTLWAIFEKSSFSPAERQVVYLTAIYENDCHYCMAGHSVLAKMANVPADAIAAIRDGRPIADARLEALHRFTGAIVRQRGFVAETAVDAFLAAGFTRAQVLEVILGTAVKVISNYTNHIAETPLDDFMKDTVWQPAKRAA